MDGDGADRADLMHLLVDPIRAGTHDFVIASRTRGERDPGSMNWHQVLAGQAAGLGMRALYGVRYTDMCAFRAIRRSSLLALGLREMTYGWNIEMQMQAARAGLRILEVPVPYRCRAGGQSKVAGSVRGTLRAGWRIVTTFARVAASPRPPGPSRVHREAGALVLACWPRCSAGPPPRRRPTPQAVMGLWWTQDRDGVVEIDPVQPGAVRPGRRDRRPSSRTAARPRTCTATPAAIWR